MPTMPTMTTMTTTSPHATVAILSIGQMGAGIASLLLAHNFRVTTNVSTRSAATQSRAASAGITLLSSDTELVATADYILSIVPPKDSRATAQRIVDALAQVDRGDKAALWYLDLNAGSPSSARGLSSLFARDEEEGRVVFVDGGIIGGPPTRSPSSSSSAAAENETWAYRPGIPLSGPHSLSSAPIAGKHLASVLNTRHLNSEIGTASGLKACFAALTKGFTALALQSFTTAGEMGVLAELGEYMDVYNPGARERAERGVVGCKGKAYRWVEEMRLIGETFAMQGGFVGKANVFREIAGVYQGLAEMVEEEGGEGLESAEGVVGRLGTSLREGRGDEKERVVKEDVAL
ncbi:hypothetical protein E8E13_008298 [Curvularia kusanoi]|uniref:6-phosphogluconate dehydrogenase C-terminal domain-like protein n=1 Tax=Curvularia kusanoi TaxID=90978 RepID=A0A9P4TFY1_CURKU|nr:hypothetical protein E8E13_008298 [Curvularia kusanoi]